MKKKLTYIFDDEAVSKFCYSLSKKKIEVYFDAYYDAIRNIYIKQPCVWTIENWEYAKIMAGTEERRYDLNKHMGIFSLILYMKYNDDEELEIGLLTVEDRYLTLFFKDPELSLKEIV